MADMSNIAALLARGNNGGQQRSYLDSPMYQQMLAQTLAQGQPQSEYPGQAIANTASQLIQAYMLKQGMQQAQQKQQAGNQSLADALLPGQDVPGMSASTQLPWATSEAPAPAVPGGVAPRPVGIFGPQVDVSTPGFKVDDPNNAGLVAALNGGAIDAQSLAPALMQKFGLGAPKEAIKLNKDDRLYAPGQYDKPLVDAAPPEQKAPTTRQVEVGDNIQTQEWDGKKWNDVATAQRYKPVAPSMSVNVSGDRSFATTVGGKAADILDASHSAAQGALSTIDTSTRIRQALDTGNVTAGPGTTAIQFFRQVAGGDENKIVETRKTIQGMAQLALDARQKLKGQGQISDYEGKLLKEASSGNIDGMTTQEIRTVADIADRSARFAIRDNAAQVAKARKQLGKDSGLVDFYDVQEPPQYASQNAGGGGGRGGGPAKVTGDADYNKLPPGAEFIGPDGVHRRKP